MSDEWYRVSDGEHQGPVSAEALQQLAAAGQLQGSDLVWKEGMAEWTPASGVELLANAIAARIPKTPPAIPRRPQAVAPPGPVGPASQPATSQSPAATTGHAAGQNTLAALTAFGNRAKAAGRAAADKAKRANAAVPNQIKVGKFTVPNMVAYGAAALVVIVLGWFMFGGSTNLTASKLQAAYAGIKSDKSGPYDETFVRVTGKVAYTRYYDASNTVAADRTHVALQTETDDEVMCIFKGQSSGGKDLNSLSRGDEISVKGKCMGRNMVGGVVIEQCELVVAPEPK